MNCGRLCPLNEFNMNICIECSIPSIVHMYMKQCIYNDNKSIDFKILNIIEVKVLEALVCGINLIYIYPITPKFYSINILFVERHSTCGRI